MKSKAVPKDYHVYYVIEKDPVYNPYSYNHFDEYKKGETITVSKKNIEAKSYYGEGTINFLKNNCRLATQKEIDEFYENNFSSALLVENMYGTSDAIRYFYILNHELINEYLDIINGENGDFIDINSSYVDWYFQIGSRPTFLNEGILDGEIFFYVDDIDFYCERSQNLLKICHKPTFEQCLKFNEHIMQVTNKRHEEYLAEEKRIKEEHTRIFNEHKEDASYYPGACGNFKQVVYIENKRPVLEKQYSLSSIKAFFKKLIEHFKNQDNSVLDKLIFYGGTIPYLVNNETNVNRKFGDVDIFVPIADIAEVREAFESTKDFQYIYNSNYITKIGSLTTSNGYHYPYYFNSYDDEEYYEDYYKDYLKEKKKIEEISKIKSKYQDYGFKGKLFDVNISVFPIYRWENDGNISICAKSFRVPKEDDDWHYLLNTTIINDLEISDFYTEALIEDYKFKIAKFEYTIASKKSALAHGYKLRKETDEFDLLYLEQNKENLNIKEELYKEFETKIPDYGIAKVYKIAISHCVGRRPDIRIISPEVYKHLVTRDSKPS